MLKKGDPILHPHHGAGVVISLSMFQVGGLSRQYYEVQLVSGKGTLSIPVEQAEESGMRLAEMAVDMSDIHKVLTSKPRKLPGDYRERQARILKKIQSGDLKAVAQALRDLEWRDYVDKLSSKDLELKLRARDLLASLMALSADVKDIDEAHVALSEILNQSMQKYGGVPST